MPNDLINLIREGLVGRSFYVQVGDDCSKLFDSDVGTIQRSILGPVLYVIFVSPLFDLQSPINFADDSFCVIWNKNLVLLVNDLEMRLEMIVKWLKGSCLVVNEELLFNIVAPLGHLCSASELLLHFEPYTCKGVKYEM